MVKLEGGISWRYHLLGFMLWGHIVSTNEPKTEALLNVKTQAQPKTQHNKMGLKLNDKQSYCNGQATQRSCHSTINTAQQIQLANRFDSLVC
ncbi:hypothetical protein F2Q70_00032340 [Brassica cretica]|uniref:Uncharacterized protein n=2 Tax=Brassica cretica TaxID=69181 RepID=A0A8S9FCG6_BRACR|nr:hypothetical protein F2Q70_00032340 [Brassica cretica]KAF2553527.1 hypothetical protein F2Q68_00036718 [Brassica cretica]KAF3595269.1 hypothetical protein DY000_02026015 [Brassica cretica]